MRKIVIIILALVVALSALPVTFACYNGGWGNWHHFWHPHQPVYCCPTNCNLIFTSVTAYDNENEDNFTEPKEVAETTAEITCCGKKITITVDNAYPGYQGIVDFCVTNTGSQAATITGITTDPPDPVYYQTTLTGVQGITIQQCEIKCGQLVIGGVPQLEEAQDKDFTFTITIDYNCTCTPPGGCETAYAYGGCCYAHCFKDLGLGFNDWGWTNGPLEPRCYVYTFPIYTGAAQCDISKGTKVGWLTVRYNGSTALVTYHMYTYKGYKMTETHLYVGNEILPKKNGDYTVAPGQYPFKHENLNNASTDWYWVTGLSSDIYVVAHAVVCR